MEPKVVFLRSCLILLILYSELLEAGSNNGQTTQSAPLGPGTKIVEKWRGTLDVKAIRHQPQPAQQVTYVETFDWVLDRRYLRSETSCCRLI